MYNVQGWVERSPIAQEQSTEAHSSSGLGHRPLKAEITGSNPVCAIRRPWDSMDVFFSLASSLDPPSLSIPIHDCLPSFLSKFLSNE
jgi:hypothetical protein